MSKQQETTRATPVITLDPAKILGGVQTGTGLVAAGTKQVGLKPASK